MEARGRYTADLGFPLGQERIVVGAGEERAGEEHAFGIGTGVASEAGDKEAISAKEGGVLKAFDLGGLSHDKGAFRFEDGEIQDVGAVSSR